MIKPPIQYTMDEETCIAYQVFGAGSVDLLLIPGWVSNIDLMWNQPEFVWYINELSKMARVILIDKRGSGLSDRTETMITMEERVMDIANVLNAVDSKEAILFGQWEAAAIAIAFTKKYPKRVVSLMLLSPFVCGSYSSSFKWGFTPDNFKTYSEYVRKKWRNEISYKDLVPSRETDKNLLEWIAFYHRCSSSHKAAQLSIQMHRQLDVLDDLAYIEVPTLIMSNRNELHTSHEEAIFIAKRIKKSFLLELVETAPLFWAVGTQELMKYIKTFLQGKFEKVLFTDVFPQVLSSYPFSPFLELVLEKIGKFFFNADFGIQLLCEELAVSERQLQRKLKEVVNQSPSQFITYLKLAYAKELLQNHSGNISEIAFQSGFSDPSYFTRCFKKNFGISPSAYD